MTKTKHTKGIILSFIVTQLSPIFIYGILLLTSINPITLLGISIMLGSVLGFSMMLYITKDEWENLFRFPKKRTINYGLLGFLLVIIAQILLITFIQWITGDSIATDTEERVIELSNVNLFFLFVPLILGPIQEELVFRYAILGSLIKRMKPLYAIILSSSLFALAHGSMMNFIVYFSFGLVFSYIYLKSKSIMAPIIAHIIMNTVVILNLLILM